MWALVQYRRSVFKNGIAYAENHALAWKMFHCNQKCCNNESKGIRKQQVSLSVRNLKSPPSRTQRKAPHLSLDRSVNLVRKTFSTIIRLLKTCWLFSRFIFRLSSRGYLQSCLCVLAQGLFDSMGSLLLSQALKGTQIQMIVSLWVKIIVSVGDVSCATVRASCW